MILGKNMMYETLEKWNKTTFQEAFDGIERTEENEASLKLLAKVLKHQKLTDKKMNGLCTEGLKKTEAERLGVKYVDFFNELESSSDFWTPTDLLHNLCKHNLNNREKYEKKAKKMGISFDKLTWLMCGRALRALPSYMREHQLKNELENTFPNASFCQNAELDTYYHCDVKMTMNDEDYFVWSFLTSPRSIVNFASKFKGQRYGTISTGKHVLCPYDREKESEANFAGWMFYSKEYMDELKKAVLDTVPVVYDDVVKASVYDLEFYLNPIVIEKFDIAS